MFFRSCGRKTRLGYHRRPARADTAKTLNFVAKAPTALAHANFTMLRRRASPACPDHPLLPVANPLLPCLLSCSKFASAPPNYVGGFST